MSNDEVRFDTREAQRLIHAETLVADYIQKHLAPADKNETFHVYIVWFSKTLQNWKALLSSTIPDDMYYEVTYDGDKRQSYLDAYKKLENVVIKDGTYAEPRPTPGTGL